MQEGKIEKIKANEEGSRANLLKQSQLLDLAHDAIIGFDKDECVTLLEQGCRTTLRDWDKH
jgi:hypothetical protein